MSNEVPLPGLTCAQLVQKLIQVVLEFSANHKEKRREYTSDLAQFTPFTVNTAFSDFFRFLLVNDIVPADFGGKKFTGDSDYDGTEHSLKTFKHTFARTNFRYEIILECWPYTVQAHMKLTRDDQETDRSLWQVKQDLFHILKDLTQTPADSDLVMHMLKHLHNRCNIVIHKLLHDNQEVINHNNTGDDKALAMKRGTYGMQLQQQLDSFNQAFMTRHNAGDPLKENLETLLTAYDK
eukprot:3018449-Rhodomonas_salina.1